MRPWSVLLCLLMGAPVGWSQQPRCEDGQAEACLEEGLRLANGRGGSARDPALAIRSLGTACQAGSAAACLHREIARSAFLGDSSALGSAANAVDTAGLETVRAAYAADCKAGAMAACYQLGVVYEEGVGVASDMGAALGHYKTACTGKVARACLRQAHVLEQGPPAWRDPMQAQELFKQACNAGAGEACRHLGEAAEGRGDAGSLRTAERRYREGCDADDAASCGRLGRMHVDGRAEMSDAAEGKRLLDKACKAGDASSCGG